MDSILTDFLAAALRLGTSLAPLQLAPCSFQYTTSTPPGFTLKSNPTKFQYASRARCAQHLRLPFGGFSACDSQLVTAAGPPAAVEVRFIKLRRL